MHGLTQALVGTSAGQSTLKGDVCVCMSSGHRPAPGFRTIRAAPAIRHTAGKAHLDVGGVVSGPCLCLLCGLSKCCCHSCCCRLGLHSGNRRLLHSSLAGRRPALSLGLGRWLLSLSVRYSRLPCSCGDCPPRRSAMQVVLMAAPKRCKRFQRASAGRMQASAGLRALHRAAIGNALP